MNLECETESWITETYPPERHEPVRREFHSAVDDVLQHYLSQASAREVLQFVEQDQRQFAEDYPVDRGTELLDKWVLAKVYAQTLN
jgi:hypothetical protein